MSESAAVVKKFLPCEQLSQYILAYFYFSSEIAMPSQLNEPSVGNMILTVVVEGEGKFSNENKSEKISRTQVFGPHERPNQYTIYGPRFTMLNIILKPVAASLMFKVNPDQFADDVVNVNDLLPPSKQADLEDLVGTVTDTVLLKKHLDAFFVNLLPSQNEIYKSILANDLLEYLDESRGKIKVKDTVRYFKTSEQYLRRRFNQYVGISPKLYARILGFREDFLEHYERDQSDKSSQWLEYFYDQSHRIRNYKEFTGYTPQSLPKERFAMTYAFLKMSKKG